VVVVALALLIARLVHLQVVQHDYYTTRAEDNRISLVPIVPNRGVIVDRQRYRPGAQLLGIHA
jgi:penicillin-binding protein 2